MKRLFTFLAIAFLTISLFAQPPQLMNYQTVVRNSSNALVTNHAVGMRISILQGSATGTAVYVETQTPTTNANGLASLQIGGGTGLTGIFSAINWEAGPYYFKTEIDPTGGSNYIITGTNQMLSVPYALYDTSAGVFILTDHSQETTLNNGRFVNRQTMEETYQLLIEFKTIHPLRFWTTIFIATSLIVFAIWSLLRKKLKAKNEQAINQGVTSIVTVEKETATPTFETNNEQSFFEKQQSKINTDTSVKTDLAVNEHKPIYSKQTETKQEKVIPKDETIDVKLKPKHKSEEQLPKAKVETSKPKDEVIFVNYDISKAQMTNSYPVFRFPKKGTVVRSFRLGNTKRRGFKEDSFQISIEQYFGKDFNVLGNARLNTGKETRPFEPDIAIIDNSNANIRIDIEIDEPYAGITRQPTHCKGEDVNRDIYFVDRGWIVIRFSEYQVHLQEDDCLRYIAETIKLAIPKYEIPSQLLKQPSLQVEKLWDIVQAQKWEKAKYREQYLNHTFLHTEEQKETIERDFDEQELLEEKLVKPTLIGEFDNKQSIAFNRQNAHARDSRIKFYPEPHVYTIDNTPAPSASTIIAKFFPEFDSVYWANRKAPELGMTPDEVELMWRTRGQAAAKDGTFLHEQIENFYLEQEYKKTEEFHLFESFVKENNHIKPYRTEWRIFDEHHHIAGTIDLISKIENGYEMYDWKRSKKVVNIINGEPIKFNQWQRGVGQLVDIDDTSYNRYCLQQSLYKYILEKNYGLTVSKMFLIVLYPDYDRYYKVEVPYLKDKVEYILNTL
jgi:very-short-patch-repair endonuclease